ncbi:UDP-glucosyltransferase 2 [Halyomorpha halys]|uniref:UDP-glucosyltransferase 2 n=1 Tax=Halyomorpha halys TaxID=286706 RepID=UPI0006D4D38F|nr:UDP-glucuronosyltransferase 2C1-like [Halyomorpha halys]
MTLKAVLKMKGVICVFIFSIVSYCQGYNILVMMPFPMYSHTKSYLPLFLELAERGHNVTMVSQFPLKEPVPNFNEVIVEDTMKKRMDKFDQRAMEWFLMKVLGPRLFCSFMLDSALESESLTAFLKDTDSKFDMVITETFFCQEPFIALGHKYGAVQVSVQTISLFMGLARVTGNPHNPAYMPSSLFPLTHHMNFWERSKNTLVNFVDYIMCHTSWMYLDYWMRSRFEQYPGFENLPPIMDMFKNVSLVLVDNQMAISYPRPYLPNVVEIGGLTIKEGDKLDEEWEKYLNESVDGVIYFSWGSHYKTENMRPHELSAFMSAFGKLKQRVLMKVDEDNVSLPGKPDNVRLAKWVPQASVLGHHNLRAFVSHGGLHGVLEGTYHGVPIIGTPLFADQMSNIKFCEEAGYCIYIDLDTVTEEILLDAFHRILTNSSYKEIAVTRSKIMKDKPLSVMDNAVYWVEYVLRHRGAPHLRSAAVELSWYQYLLLDVIVVWGAVFAVTIVLFRKIVKSVCKARRSKSKKD